MADYTEQLALDFDPFDADLPTGHFYPGGGRQELLDQLIEYCCYSSALTAVTGPLGSGKSTVSQWLSLSLDDDFVPVQVRAELFMSTEQLLEAICRGLQFDVPQGLAREELLGRLDDYAESLRGRAKALQLLIDDAHELGEEALRVIIQLQQRHADSAGLGEDGIKLVLLGEPMLLDVLSRVVSTVENSLELQPLDADEGREYVEFKLASAGYHGKLPIDLDEMSIIQARSRGMPGAIDILVTDALNELDGGSGTLPALGFAERHLVAASALFGVLLIVLFFTLGDDNTGQSVDTPAVASGDRVADGKGTGAPGRITVPLAVSGNRDPGPDSDSAVDQPGVEDAPDPGNSESVTVAANVEPAIAPAPDLEEVEAASQAVAGRQVETAAAASTEPEVAVEPVAVAAVPDKPVPEPISAPARVVPDSARPYTLQVLGSRSENNVRDFIARNNNTGELAYYETRFQDLPWYVIVHGRYPTREAARAAISQLPPSLRELEPWARLFSDLQAESRQGP